MGSVRKNLPQPKVGKNNARCPYDRAKLSNNISTTILPKRNVLLHTRVSKNQKIQGMIIAEIEAVLEAFAPLSLQEEYDNSGLIIGDPGIEVTGILITLDVTDEVLDEASEKGCNLIVAHHPLIFKGIHRLTPADPVQRMVIKAINRHLAVYAMHTNLDNSLDGLNQKLCSLLGITKVRILLPSEGLLRKLVTFCPVDHAGKVREALFAAGAGHIGNYDSCSFNSDGQGTFRASENANPFVGEKNVLHVEPEVRIEVIFPKDLEHKVISSLLGSHPYEEVAYDIYPLSNKANFAGSGVVGELASPLPEDGFLMHVKHVLGIPVIRHSKNTGLMIQKVALCTGSGAFLIRSARKAGVQAFLTSDLKYHDFFEADGKMMLADIGHYESERSVKELIYDILIKKFPTFAILISKTDTNPVHYY
jgi:dinuclear metal center YbgI/SA1388 family protein